MLLKVRYFTLHSFVGCLVLLTCTVPLILSTITLDKKTYILQKQENWVDSVFQTLTEPQKIGQLFSIRAHSNLDEKHCQEVEKLVRDYQVGGLCFFQGGPYRQAVLTNRYQKVAKIPLLVAIDGEWGLGMRLDSSISFPKQMTLGAIQEDTLIYEMGQEIARQCQRIGIHVNFAPVVDVNNNPNNPVIGDRSFGENKYNVARKGVAYMKGMQDKGLIANAKHFPGHGDTDKDSHYTLPIINHKRERLDSIELYPFKQLIQNGLMSTMVAHLKIPAFDQIQTTLSKKVITDLLKRDMAFEGLIFTDAMEMKGVSAFYAPGEADLLALLAGNDVLTLSGDVPKAILMIHNAIQQKKISWEEINKRVKKILRAKHFAGLHQYKAIDLKNIHQDLNISNAYLIQEKLYEKAITLLKNQNQLIPFKNLDTCSFASVSVGLAEKSIFQKNLDNYADFEHFQIPQNALTEAYHTVYEKLKNKNIILVSLHGLNKNAALGYGISQNTLAFLQKLKTKANSKTVISVFGYPYSLKYFEDSDYLLCGYEENWLTQKLIPQILFGALEAKGKLPVSASNKLKEGTGIETKALQRLAYGNPESVGLRTDSLLLLDNFIQQAIKDTIMPGCQLLIARKGKVVLNKAYGYFSYDKKTPVTTQTLYDVASITKMAATLQAIMWLYDKDSLDLDKKVSFYLPELKKTDKNEMTVREVLSHQTGLTPYIPYWERTMTKHKNYQPKYYSPQKSEKYPYQVAQGLYSVENIEEVLWKWTIESELANKEKGDSLYNMAYSDLSFYILKRIAERILKQPIEEFLQKDFYSPLGLHWLGFNPLAKYPKESITPTEKDDIFRKQLIQGTVHDQGAALLGGVGGHAGLFSNANDLAILMSMHLQKGFYGGRQYFKAETIETFTKSHYARNRRGLGWDKAGKEPIGYIPDSTSVLAYGHSGFTGCVVWADPKKELLIVFLSNRIHPTVDNQKMVKGHFRRKLMNKIYGAIKAD